jgi:hypothetical protein
MSSRTTLFHRAAVAIHEQLVINQSEMPEGLPAVSWSECCRLARLIEKADRKGWYRAVCRLRCLLAQAIRRLTVALNEVQQSLAPPKPESTPTVRDVLADLQALSTEFDEIKVSTTNHTIGVLTDCVILDGVGLGRFEIVLDWEHLHETGAYDVIAQDGCAAETDSDTTHPHVQSNSLCEGEGKVAISKALTEGRLFDFFVLVRQILHTYNPSSAYVQLDDWFGIQCPDCGSTTGEDETTLCEGCATMTCFECSTRCTDCDYRYCSDCIRICTGCESDICSSCRSLCSECGDGFCKGCINAGRCLLCIEKAQEKEKSPSV